MIMPSFKFDQSKGVNLMITNGITVYILNANLFFCGQLKIDDKSVATERRLVFLMISR